MAYSFGVKGCPVDEFARRVALERDKQDGMNEIEQKQAARMIELATLMAQEGHVGTDWVGAEFMGHANEDHQPKVGKHDSNFSFALWQAAAPDAA